MNSERARALTVGGVSVPLPCFFPSISSVKTNLLPADYLEFLVTSGHPTLLISAYDVANATPNDRERMLYLLSRAVDSGQMVLMDSGNYEAFWKNDRAWDAAAFSEVAEKFLHQLCFCHDNQSPPETADAIAADVVGSVLRDQESAIGTVVPIVHGHSDVLPEAVLRVAGELYPPLIAVPERALGEGILARAATVRRIRAALNQVGGNVPLHLLGTGNPVSLLVYALAGADSFDGLEWCQTVVDHATGRLHHFQHWDFLADQEPLAQESDLPYVQKVLLHNLLFYRRFMTELVEALAAGDGEAFARRWLSGGEFERLAAVVGGNQV